MGLLSPDDINFYHGEVNKVNGAGEKRTPESNPTNDGAIIGVVASASKFNDHTNYLKI